jgi:hypothetical protein
VRGQSKRNQVLSPRGCPREETARLAAHIRDPQFTHFRTPLRKATHRLIEPVSGYKTREMRSRTHYTRSNIIEYREAVGAPSSLHAQRDRHELLSNQRKRSTISHRSRATRADYSPAFPEGYAGHSSHGVPAQEPSILLRGPAFNIPPERRKSCSRPAIISQHHSCRSGLHAYSEEPAFSRYQVAPHLDDALITLGSLAARTMRPFRRIALATRHRELSSYQIRQQSGNCSTKTEFFHFERKAHTFLIR